MAFYSISHVKVGLAYWIDYLNPEPNVPLGYWGSEFKESKSTHLYTKAHTWKGNTADTLFFLVEQHYLITCLSDGKWKCQTIETFYTMFVIFTISAFIKYDYLNSNINSRSAWELMIGNIQELLKSSNRLNQIHRLFPIWH